MIAQLFDASTPFKAAPVNITNQHSKYKQKVKIIAKTLQNF